MILIIAFIAFCMAVTWCLERIGKIRIEMSEFTMDIVTVYLKKWVIFCFLWFYIYPF